ncbi:MAG: cobalamin-dependent protein [Clostridia bacterium]|nr:cobalamin-dependent protein [Clostridia bacterium]
MVMDKQAIIDAMADLEEDELYDFMNEIMDNGGEGVYDALEACQEGMKIVGDRFEEGEYFVGDLIYAGEILTEATNIIKPALTGDGQEKYGKMILCTVKNDLHDIGKNIVRAMLEAGGFDVMDLGIDVDPQTIVDTAKNEDIHIIALSGVLTLAVDSMKDTIEAFKAAGMRDDVKIIVGGAPVTETVCASVGADEWALSPQKTVSVCQAWAS